MTARASRLAGLLLLVTFRPAAAQTWQAVEFDPRGPAPGAASPLTLDLVEERARWQWPDAVQVSDEPRPERRAVEVRLDHPDRPVALTRAGDYAPEELRELELSVTAVGHSRVRARLRGEDGAEVASPWAPIRPSVKPRTVFTILPASPAGTRYQRLILEFEGASALVRVRRVTATRVSVDRLLDGLIDGHGMALWGDESRRAAPVSTTRPAQARFAVPADAELRFAAAQPPRLALLSAPSRLQVGLVDPAVPDAAVQWITVARSAAQDGALDWKPCVVSLDAWAGTTMQVTLRVVTESGADAGWVVAHAAQVVPSRHAPLVLLVTTDTHRGDHLGFLHGPEFLRTPVLDALAARGVWFEDCLAPSNRTNPSHAALLTGTHPRDTGLLANRQTLGPGWSTLADRFREQGYRTLAALSVNHLGHARSGLGQGFDRVNWPRVGKRDAADTADVLLDWLDQSEGEPVFAWFHLFDAHRPYQPPGGLDRAYYPADRDPKDPGLPEPGLQEQWQGTELDGVRDLDYARAQYRAEITYLDRELGRVLAHPRAAEAVVAFVGDHGEALGDNQVWFAHNGLYPAVTHVPLLLSWPGGPRGVRRTDAVRHLDVGRTLLDLAGFERAPFPGANLVTGTPPEGPRRRFMLADQGHAAALQQDQWYLVMHLRDCQPPFSRRAYQRHQVELYDRSADPGCREDRVDQEPRIARFLRKVLLDWLGEARAPAEQVDAVDPEYLEELRQLGYLDGGEDGASFEDDGCEWCRRFR